VDNVVLYITCLGLGGVGAWVVSRWGQLFSLLDRADHRSSHQGVVPKGGGQPSLCSGSAKCEG